jgi:hypothetical protein
MMAKRPIYSLILIDFFPGRYTFQVLLYCFESIKIFISNWVVILLFLNLHRSIFLIISNNINPILAFIRILSTTI